MTSGDAAPLLVDDDDGVRTLTMNRPDARNALSDDLVATLVEAMQQVVDDGPAVRACVLRGAGGIFCAGGDLKLFKAAFDGSLSHAQIAEMNLRGGVLFDAFASLPCPTIAAVEKAAMGGGVGLAAMADITIATASTVFSTTETTLGLVPSQIAIHLVDRLGRHRARKLMTTGTRLDATQAADLGLVDEVVEDAAGLDDAIVRWTTSIKRCAPRANAMTKALIDHAALGDRATYAQVAAERFADALTGEEAIEGLKAFVTKSTPPWNTG